MEATSNVILIKTPSGKTETPDSTGKTYRTATAPTKTPAENLAHSGIFTNPDDLELEQSIYDDILADEKGRKAALLLIKGQKARALIVHTIKANGLDKTKVVAGIVVVLKQYRSGEAITLRNLCESAATDTTPRRFLEERIIPIFTDLGIICRLGERSSHWQTWNKIGRNPTLLERAKLLLELTPEQVELKQLADQAYAEQRKLNALKQREQTMEQQKQAYMRITTQQQQLAELAGQHPTQATLWDKAKANPAATLIVSTLAAGVLLAAFTGKQPTDDAPMPTVSAAMQPVLPTPDTAAVAALETAQIRAQMQQMESKP